jgi:hypothetical protein
VKSDDAAADRIALEPTPEHEIAEEAPLVGTLRFVFVMGAAFVLLWLAMYVLLRVRF